MCKQCVPGPFPPLKGPGDEASRDGSAKKCTNKGS